jgi:hypothetical protein
MKAHARGHASVQPLFLASHGCSKKVGKFMVPRMDRSMSERCLQSIGTADRSMGIVHAPFHKGTDTNERHAPRARIQERCLQHAFVSSPENAMHWIDPDSLPETRGVVAQFLLNPRGELDGLILRGARQVHFPPHMSKWVARHIAIGDRIRVRGVKPRGIDMIAAVSLTASSGATRIDEGPAQHAPHQHETARKPMEVSGTVRLSLHGPKGELRGALLDDGTSLRVPPHAGDALRDYLTPGASVYAWGHGVKNRFGRVVDVDDIAHWVDAPA